MPEKIIKEYHCNALSTLTAMLSVKYSKYYCTAGHKLDTTDYVHRTWSLKCQTQLETYNITLAPSKLT